MSDPYTLAAVAIIALAVGICVNHWIAAPERRRKDNDLYAAEVDRDDAECRARRATVERDYWRSKYHREVGRLIAEVHGTENATFHLMQWEREMEAEL